MGSRFNEAFGLDLPTPVLRLERLRAPALGTYKQGRNGFGLLHQLAVNTQHLRAPLAEQLVYLLRGLLQEWQHLHGTASPWNYYNAEFRRKAGFYGLVFDVHGRLQGVEPGRFTQLLTGQGVDLAVLAAIPEAARQRRGRSKMKKWSCGCTTVRAARVLTARCWTCGNEFRRAEAE